MDFLVISAASVSAKMTLIHYVAVIPPTDAETANSEDRLRFHFRFHFRFRFRFRFRSPSKNGIKSTHLLHEHKPLSREFGSE